MSMSLEQVNAFYEVLTSNQAIYDEYFHKCCLRGLFGIWNWDTAKIVDFAASLDFHFTVQDLETVLFEGDAGVVKPSISLSVN
jgi:hypothetical protein